MAIDIYLQNRNVFNYCLKQSNESSGDFEMNNRWVSYSRLDHDSPAILVGTSGQSAIRPKLS